MEDEDFLAEIGKDDDAATIEQPAEPVVEAPAEPVAEPVAVEPAPEPAKPEPGFVPFAAVLDERDKRKERDAENERLKEQLKQYQQAPAQAPPAPDMFEDPDGYRAHQVGEAHRLALNVKLDLSEDMARGVHGDELVDKARDWAVQKFQQSPGYQAEVFNQRNPYNYVVAQYQRDQIASTVTPDEFTQFMAWKQAQAGLTPAPTPTDNPSPAKYPPRSLASAPSAGPAATEPVQSDEEIFAETFARK